MLKRALIPLAMVSLTACETSVVDQFAQERAKDAIRPVLEENFPGVPVEPATDCIIDNATAGEILDLAGDAVTGVTAGTVATVAEIISRPDTIACLAEEGLPAILRQL